MKLEQQKAKLSGNVKALYDGNLRYIAKTKELRNYESNLGMLRNKLARLEQQMEIKNKHERELKQLVKADKALKNDILEAPFRSIRHFSPPP